MSTEEPKRRVLESQRNGTGVEAPTQLRLSNMDVQRTTVDGLTNADGSSGLGGVFFLQAVVGMKPEKTTTQFTAREEIVILPMSWQQQEVELENVKNKFDSIPADNGGARQTTAIMLYFCRGELDFGCLFFFFVCCVSSLLAARRPSGLVGKLHIC